MALGRRRREQQELLVATTSLFQSPGHPFAKMKDGTTHVAYKPEHALDVESDLVLAARVYAADQGDASALSQTLALAQTHLVLAGSEAEIRELAADRGYHSNETVTWCDSLGLRTYIPDPRARTAGDGRMNLQK